MKQSRYYYFSWSQPTHYNNMIAVSSSRGMSPVSDIWQAATPIFLQRDKVELPHAQ